MSVQKPKQREAITLGRLSPLEKQQEDKSRCPKKDILQETRGSQVNMTKNLLLCHVVSLARQVNADFFKAFPEPLCLNITGVKVD